MKWIYLTLVIVLLPLILIQIGALVGIALGLWSASFQTIAESVTWTVVLSALCAAAAFRWRSLTHRRIVRGFPVDPVRPPQ